MLSSEKHKVDSNKPLYRIVEERIRPIFMGAFILAAFGGLAFKFLGSSGSTVQGMSLGDAVVVSEHNWSCPSEDDFDEAIALSSQGDEAAANRSLDNHGCSFHMQELSGLVLQTRSYRQPTMCLREKGNPRCEWYLYTSVSKEETLAPPLAPVVSDMSLGDLVGVSKSSWSCRQEGDFDEAIKLLGQGNKAAAVRALSRNCSFRKESMSSMALERRSFLHPTTCLRQIGQPYCEWYLNTSIKK